MDKLSENKQVYVSDYAFVDDITIITENQKNLEENLNIWNQILRNNKIKINKNKTKTMIGQDRI